MIQNREYKDWESFFVAVSDRKIIGMIALLKEDYYPLPEIYPWISSIFVSEEYRGEGLLPTGLYEKYGYVYLKNIVNYGGHTDKLYVKELY